MYYPVRAFPPGRHDHSQPHHPAHCSQCRQNDDPFDKIRQFFHRRSFKSVLYFILYFPFLFRSAKLPCTSEQLFGLLAVQLLHPCTARCCALAGAARFGKAGKVRVGAALPGEKPSGAMWAPRRSPAQPFYRWAATACPETPCPPGSCPRQNRSPRTQSQGRSHRRTAL